MKNTHAVFLLVIGLALTTSCKSKSKLGDEEKGPTVASVNGVKITTGQLERRLPPGSSGEKVAETKKQTLDQIINQEAVFQEAVKKNYHRKEHIKSQIVDLYLKDVVDSDKIESGEADVKKYYDEHKDELGQIRVSHVLIKPTKAGDAKSEEAARTKAEEVMKKARAGEDFTKLAAKYSQDLGTAKRGGDLRTFKRNQVVKAFADASFALQKVGDISDVIKTDYGYHVIKLTEDQRSLEALAPVIKTRIAPYLRNKRFEEVSGKIRKSASVSISEKNLEKVGVH